MENFHVNDPVIAPEDNNDTPNNVCELDDGGCDNEEILAEVTMERLQQYQEDEEANENDEDEDDTIESEIVDKREQ